MGFSCQYPQQRARERDEEAIRQWRLVEWPRIKKARQKGVTIAWIDQSGFMLQPTRRRTWALRGHTPLHKVWDRHDRLSVQAAVTLPPQRQRLGVYFRMYEHNIDRQDVVSFVGHLLRMIRRKVVLILDRWSVHRAAVAIQKRYRIVTNSMHPNQNRSNYQVWRSSSDVFCYAYCRCNCLDTQVRHGITTSSDRNWLRTTFPYGSNWKI